MEGIDGSGLDVGGACDVLFICGVVVVGWKIGGKNGVTLLFGGAVNGGIAVELMYSGGG